MNSGETTSPASSALLWGGHLLDLHDRLWAARGVRVVRPGGQPVERRGPSLYALLGPTMMTEFPLEMAIKPLHWAKPRAIRLRILDHADLPYRETVVADRESRLVAIRREYTQRSAATGRAWLTPDVELARAWHAQRSARTAVDQLRMLARKRESFPLKVPGIVTHLQDAAGVNRWLRGAIPNADNADRVFDRVYPYQEHVWSHETATISPTARFFGPVLVGAGREVPEGAILIGPGVMTDDPETARPELPAIRWDELRSGDWHLSSPRGLLPDLRRGGKRLFDIVFSVGVLLATLPLYPLVMLAIYREDGRPFFFGHPRQSIGGREFPCYKFRTMCRDAERMKSQLVAANVADGPQFFIPDDPRLLRVGKFLRKYQIDELPQFWNVLLGHMSVVGPRPSPDKENQYSPAWREARLSTRPGVTGLWQVRRTREPLTDFQEWIRYDLEYVRHYSFSRDIRIIVETIRQLLKLR